MSKKFKVHYSGFNRAILQEFMAEKELNELDKKYTKAKMERLIKNVAENCGIERTSVKVEFLAKQKGEKGKQAREIIRLNKEADKK